MLDQAKEKLDKAYNSVEKEYLQEKINTIRSASQSRQSGLAWAVMNDVTGRTATRLKGNTSSERCKEWRDYFSTLLGSPPLATNPDEEIQTINENTLPIETGAFTTEELQA